MDYLMAYPSDKGETTNAAHPGSPQPSSGDFGLEPLPSSDEAFLSQATENPERQRAESPQVHCTDGEKETLAASEANRLSPEQQTQQGNEKEQKLLADIEALRKAEAEQLQRIEEASAANRRRSAEERFTKNEIELAAKTQVEEEDAQLVRLEAISLAAESEAELRETEQQRLSGQIQFIGQTATEQIDRMDEAKARLAILEQLRVHAERKVCESAEREIRLYAEIEALRQTEEAQLKRIKEAAVEARRLTEEQARVQEAEEARRTEEAEARQRAAAEVLNQVEDQARRLAEEEEHRLEHLETVRARAESAAQQRADKEQLLNSQLLAFGEAAADQLRRIEKAETNLSEAEEELRQLEEKALQTSEQAAITLAETERRRQTTEEELARAEAEARSLAEQEEQRLAELESLRSQAATRVRHHLEQEQGLIAAIKALNEAEAEQLNRIADAESALRAREEELQAAAFEVTQDVDLRTGLLPDSSDENERLPSDVRYETSNAETAPLSSTSAQSDGTAVNVRLVDLGIEERVADSLLEPLENFLPPNSPEDSGKSIDSVFSEAGHKAASAETPIVASLAKRFRTGDPTERANVLEELAGLDEKSAFSLITGLFDDSSEDVRNAAARALYALSTDRAKAFTQALREAPLQRRLQIITAIASSGLAADAIDCLAGESREKTHDAFAILFLMAKAGEVHSLLQTIETHASIPVRLSVIKLLTVSNRPDIIPALRSLVVRGNLPTDVRSALMDAIYEMSSGNRKRSLSAA